MPPDSDKGGMTEHIKDVLPGEEEIGQDNKAVFQHVKSCQKGLGFSIFLWLYRAQLGEDVLSV